MRAAEAWRRREAAHQDSSPLFATLGGVGVCPTFSPLPQTEPGRWAARTTAPRASASAASSARGGPSRNFPANKGGGPNERGRPLHPGSKRTAPPPLHRRITFWGQLSTNGDGGPLAEQNPRTPLHSGRGGGAAILGGLPPKLKHTPLVRTREGSGNAI